jgi:anti-anti-sigma factor
VVHFTGDKVSLDEDTSIGIHAQLLAIAEEPGFSRLLLDFGNVDYVSSTGLGILVSLHKKLLAAGRHLTIHKMSLQVHEVFAITRLDTLLDLWQEDIASDQAAPLGVLVVDDDARLRGLLHQWLQRSEWAVWSAADGQQAIELYRRHREEISLVLLDVRMPGLDGPQTLAALQTIDPAVRCCFLTANPEPYTEEGLLLSGAIRVLRKPIPFAELLEALRLVLCRPSQQEERWIEVPVM